MTGADAIGERLLGVVPGEGISAWSLACQVVQLTLAVLLLAIPHLTDRTFTFYTYYGLGVLLVPVGIRLVSGVPLRPYQRLCFSIGLALHPFSMFFGTYFVYWWWDSLTHLVSASLLAAGLYVAFRGLRGIVRGPTTANRWVHLGALVGVVAGAVVWELYEIYAPWLTVYGDLDTAKDVATAVAAWAVVAALQDRLLEEIPRAIGARWSRPGSSGNG